MSESVPPDLLDRLRVNIARLMGLLAYQDETGRILKANSRDVFVPWRWGRAWRTLADVRRRQAHVRREIAAIKAERDAINAGFGRL